MAKATVPVVVGLAFGLVAGTTESVSAEYLLEIIADADRNIMSVRDGEEVDLEEAPFERIDGFNLLSTTSLLFNEVWYGNPSSCCRSGGRWYLGPCPQSRTLIGNSGEVVAEYVWRDGEWQEPEFTDVPEHPDAVIYQSKQKSYILAIVEKDSTRFGMLISPEGTIWHDPKEFAPTGPQ